MVPVAEPHKYAFFAICGAVAFARGVELVVSRRHERALSSRGAATVREPLFPAMVAVHAGTLAGAVVEAALRPAPPTWVAVAAGGALAAATALRLWALRTLGAAWSVHVTRFRDPEARAVATGGPYRWVRHPNYLAVIVELAALPLFGGAVVTAAAATIANALVLRSRIRREEAELARSAAWREAVQPRGRLVPRWRDLVATAKAARAAVAAAVAGR